MYDEFDEVFRALAHPDRRRIMDMLKDHPGMNVNDISDRFDYSRFAVMKHLRVLEAANLVVSRRSGNSRLLFLNAIPIQTIYDRWTSEYSALWASGLTALKYNIEAKDQLMNGDGIQQYYQYYIRTTAKELWDALFDPKITRKCFFNANVTGRPEVGSEILFTQKDENGSEKEVIKGKILEAVPREKLVYSFEFVEYDDPPTEVTYLLEETVSVVSLQVVHSGFKDETRTYEDVSNGWPLILSCFKSMVETGEPLYI